MDNQSVNLPLQSNPPGPMSKLPMIIIATAAVLLLLGTVAAWAFFGLGKTKTITTLVDKQGTNPSVGNIALGNEITTGDGATVKLPFNIDDEDVNAVNLQYFIDANVIEVKNVPEGIELVTDGALTGVPKILITKDTKINTWDGKSKPSDSSDLKANQRVRVRFINYLKTKTGTVMSVTIMLRPIPPDLGPPK